MARAWDRAPLVHGLGKKAVLRGGRGGGAALLFFGMISQKRALRHARLNAPFDWRVAQYISAKLHSGGCRQQTSSSSAQQSPVLGQPDSSKPRSSL
ncbi:hypothetical protein NDU88_001184 [Pleurodeles waltl]|uniref:Uncharacterized protein n=1 Tax=Pleurodeles waltl TaxID=8319 RepID=A0AAV7Q5A4_PLEWA|nr:hypothetical protein NDU88_001184 [Pleurodeles waltl]